MSSSRRRRPSGASAGQRTGQPRAGQRTGRPRAAQRTGQPRIAQRAGRRVPVGHRTPAGPGRAQVERRSAGLLVALSRQPRWLLPLGTVALLAGVVLLPFAGALLCLAVLLALVGWLSYLSWPALPPTARALRAATLLVVLIAGLTVAVR